MNVVTTIAALRAELDEARRASRGIGFVPTMGALHDGHLSLIRRARVETAVVVVSIFVNPMQFNEQSDLTNYPRDLARDSEVVGAARADVLFAPDVAEIYPPTFKSVVAVRDLSEPLEGVIRGAAHFAGVTTVVAKLFNIVQPTVAYFGQKDAQQALIVQRMVRDLAFPMRITICPTIREPDGLAMSSRNVLLDAEGRRRAVALKHGLDVAERMISSAERDVAAVVAAATQRMAELDVEPEYFDVVSAEDLTPIQRIAGRVLVAVAARVGGVRLIDNILVDAPTGPTE
jgi:pantoate--beta-alanine ligase